MKRVAIIVVMIALLAAGGYWLLFRGRAAALGADQAFPTVVVQRTTIVSEVAASGIAEAERELTLSFRIPGRIKAIHVSEGDSVSAGQILAELDTADLELQLRQAEAGLALAEAQYRKATAAPAEEDIRAAQAAVDSALAAYYRLLQGPSSEQIAIAEAQLKKAEVALQQAQSAYDQVKWIGGVAALQPSLALQAATTDYEAAKANYATQTRGAEDKDIKAIAAQVAQAQAQLARLVNGPSQEDLAVLEAQLAQARLPVEQARLQLQNASIVAPFSGIVASVSAQAEQMASAGLPVVTLLDTSRYHVTVRVDEADIGQIAPGQEARLEPESFPGVVLSGHVAYIAATPGGGAAIESSGVVQYPVRIDIDNGFPGLRAGMTVQVTIEVARYENVLVLPNTAVQVDKRTGITYVEKVVEGTPVLVEVMLGAAGDSVTEILAGVNEGDVVIERTTSFLQQLQSAFGPNGG